jgi:hypothetical protein
MRGDHHDVGAIGSVHNPKYAITGGGDRFVSSHPLRVSWVTLDPVGAIDRRFDPGRIDLPPIDCFLSVFAKSDHGSDSFSSR